MEFVIIIILIMFPATANIQQIWQTWGVDLFLYAKKAVSNKKMYNAKC